jgi:enoyl-CoA hydratase/carnithine racemase
MPVAEAYRYTTEVIIENAVGDAFREGLEAFVEKRRPVWPD